MMLTVIGKIKRAAKAVRLMIINTIAAAKTADIMYMIYLVCIKISMKLKA